MTDTLPTNFLQRPPTMEDVAAVTELINSCEIAQYATAEVTQDDIRTEWQSPGFELTTDAWVVIAPNSHLVAYGAVWHREDERSVFETDEEAFRDHWGHLPMQFDVWEHWTVKREDFDPALWFLAFDGNQPAGICLCQSEKDSGWVDTLAVRRPWRRKGLGMALLLHSFGEFYRRGVHKVGLNVDSQNLTGATRLYERAGMHVARQYNTYEKELRPGVELSTQSITA